MTEEQMSERAKLISKIGKLLSLSQSSNIHEAQLAAQKASELMQEHQIAFADVELREAKKSTIKEEKFEVPGLRMKLKWVEVLAHACAALFDGTILVSTNQLHGTTVSFVGYPDDIPAMKELFRHLYGAWHSIVESDLVSEKARLAGVYAYKPRDTMKFKHGHGQGYASTLFVRCKHLAFRRSEKVAASGATGTALMVVREQAVKEHVAKYKSVPIKQTRGSAAGIQYGIRRGQQAALGGAIEGGE